MPNIAVSTRQARSRWLEDRVTRLIRRGACLGWGRSVDAALTGAGGS